MFFVLLSSQATALIDYHIFCRLSTTFLFFSVSLLWLSQSLSSDSLFTLSHPTTFCQELFSSFSLHFSSCTFHIPPGLSSVFYFASAVLATKIILSPRFQIVNVFLVFYLIRTIQTILLSFSFCIHNNFIRSFYNNLLKFIFHISFRYFP